MKKVMPLAFLVCLVFSQVGCMKVAVSGGPQIRVPGGVLRGGLFPPQLLLGVTNTTPLVLRVKAISAVDRIERVLGQGEEVDIPFRAWGDCRDVSVTVSAYTPEAPAKYITTITRRYYVCGGQNRTDSWEVRQSGSNTSVSIY